MKSSGFAKYGETAALLIEIWLLVATNLRKKRANTFHILVQTKK